MDRAEREALIDKLRDENERAEADMVARRARPQAAAERLAELSANADGSPAWRRNWTDALADLDVPEPVLPSVQRVPGPVVRKAYAAPRTSERSTDGDEWQRYIDRRIMSMLGTLADEIGTQTGKMAAEIADLRKQIGVLQAIAAKAGRSDAA